MCEFLHSDWIIIFQSYSHLHMQMFPRWVLTHFTGVTEPVCTDTVLYLVCLRRHEPNYRSSVDQMCFHRHREPRVEVQQLRDAVVQRSKGKKIKATWYFNASVFCLLVQSLRHSTESWCDGQMGIMSVLITGVLTGLMWQDLFFFNLKWPASPMQTV